MTPNHQSLICYSGRNPSGHLIAWLALAATMPHQIAQCNVSPFSLPIIDIIYLITRDSWPFFMSVCLCAQRFLFDVTASIDFRWPLADIKTRTVRRTDITIDHHKAFLLTNLTNISLSFWSWCMSSPQPEYHPHQDQHHTQHHQGQSSCSAPPCYRCSC